MYNSSIYIHLCITQGSIVTNWYPSPKPLLHCIRLSSQNADTSIHAYTQRTQNGINRTKKSLTPKRYNGYVNGVNKRAPNTLNTN
jgi:hypothetical protein